MASSRAAGIAVGGRSGHRLAGWCVGVAVAGLAGCGPVGESVRGTGDGREGSGGDGRIRGAFGGSEIVITADPGLAGAIGSLTWGGVEFIDRADHGRELQSAASFDGGAGGEFWTECFNPTEAGSRLDGAGARSSSVLLAMRAVGGELRTRARMAFWLAPGEESSGRPALNRTVLSDHEVSKEVRIGHAGMGNVIEYVVTFTVPAGERHTLAQFEALTGYMPAAFGRFYTVRAAGGGGGGGGGGMELEPLDDGPGEQERPVVFSTASGGHAMGVLAPGAPPAGVVGPGYGRFRFEREGVVKWNCVYRRRDPGGVAAGEYRFRMLVVVGTLEDVRRTMGVLMAGR